jgi:hypothetical protein
MAVKLALFPLCCSLGVVVDVNELSLVEASSDVLGALGVSGLIQEGCWSLFLKLVCVVNLKRGSE